jgi:predicted nucleotidyltransferase
MSSGGRTGPGEKGGAGSTRRGPARHSRGMATGDVVLSGERRAAAVRGLRRALRGCCPGSRVALRGSLADGTADEYSDIDMLWAVPDQRFAVCLERVAQHVDGVEPVLLMRRDRDFQHSDRRRLLFFFFARLPLFWRLDLDVRASSVAADPDYDADNPAARGDDWSPAASALACAVGAVKAVRRGQPERARGLVDGAFERIGRRDAATGRWAEDIGRLTSAVEAGDPAVHALAGRVTSLASDFL